MPMTMEERHGHARAALTAYFAEKGEPARETDADYQDTDVSDLIADLLHLQNHLGHDIVLTIDRAKMHYDAEEEEEAHTVGSSHGTLSINSGGLVTRQRANNPNDEEGKAFLSIELFDIAEWKAYWRKELPSHFDILDLGYWYVEDGERRYEPPAADWRKNIAKDLLERERGG
jgi:hypothetical protein